MMNKTKQNKRIPKLRFPGFKNSGEWVEKRLSQIADYENGKAHEKNIDEEGKYIVVNSKYISSDGDTVKYSNKAFCLAKQGDILMVLSDVPNGKAIAKCFYVSESNKYTVNQRICKINPFDSDNMFLFYILNRNKYFLAFDDGVKQTNLKKDDVLNISLLLPKNKQEQQKIAECLSSLDELIEARKQKLNLLKQHKKGLMQNLFPQEGEKVPKLRFPEFKNDGEWVEKELGDKDVSIFVNDKISISQLNLNTYVSTDNMLPDYSGIIISTKLPKTERVTKFNKGDILISNIRPYLKKVWKADKQGGASNDIIVIRAVKMLISEFLEFVLKNDSFINYVMQSAKGVKMPRGDKKSMKEYIVKIPSIKEQQKIAECLSSLDEIITAEAEKIEQLERHKKGLMQGLFPEIN